MSAKLSEKENLPKHPWDSNLGPQHHSLDPQPIHCNCTQVLGLGQLNAISGPLKSASYVVAAYLPYVIT